MYRHAFDPLSAAFGIIFLLIGVPLLVGDVNLFAIRWSWTAPILAIAVGGAMLVSGMRHRDPAHVDDGLDGDEVNTSA